VDGTLGVGADEVAPCHLCVRGRVVTDARRDLVIVWIRTGHAWPRADDLDLAHSLVCCSFIAVGDPPIILVSRMIEVVVCSIDVNLVTYE